jgi:hypothetical protein
MLLNLETNSNDINDDFRRIADDLMNKWVLKIHESTYRVCEIEFYLSSNTHKDGYTHGHDLQKTSGCWYFHGSGVDITFGINGSYGGILIRALLNIDTDTYIYGPLKIITELFSNYRSVYNDSYSFGIVRSNDIKYEKPIAAPRIGLNKTKNPEMFDKFYRFLIMPREQHAEKTNIESDMKKQNYSEIEIKSIWK